MVSALIKSSTLLAGVAILLIGHGLQLALIPLRAEFMGWDSTFIGLLGSVYFGGFILGDSDVADEYAASPHVLLNVRRDTRRRHR